MFCVGYAIERIANDLLGHPSCDLRDLEKWGCARNKYVIIDYICAQQSDSLSEAQLS